MYLYNESVLFNFGYIKITDPKNDGVKHLLYEVDSDGRDRPGSSLDIVPIN